MSNEYHDAVDDGRLNTAVSAVLEALAQSPAPVDELAARAVAETFCACVSDAGEPDEGHVSTIQTEVIAEVVRRVKATVVEPTSTKPTPDAVDIASEQSFPASDPPAWIWRRGSP